MAQDETLRWVPMSDISLHPRARAHRSEELARLVASMKVQKQLQPCRGRPKGDKVELYIGHGRYLAARILEWDSLQMIIAEKADENLDLEMLHENLAREDLDPITEAQEYQYMMETHAWNQEEMAEKAAISRSNVNQSLLLLTLAPTVQENVRRLTISKSHGFLIAKIEDLSIQEQAAKEVAEKGLSVHQTGILIKRLLKRPSGAAQGPQRTPFQTLWPGLPAGVKGKATKHNVALEWSIGQYPDLRLFLKSLAESAPASLIPVAPPKKKTERSELP